MVYIKRVELSHFKSFGGTTSIPFLPGFTVVSGPNGSGKSNILDALLFCLGLATSKGMRAERLPDLVNHTHTSQRNVAEASVSVTFDLSDLPEALGTQNQENGHTANEWTVTRRLRVSKGGNYSSTYYLNGEPCTVTELHEELNRLRVYPEGYNVVLQGDVTRIITMNSKERREIIDELAGVAEFDRKIEKTKETLESVREREERCQIIAQELGKSLERLALDRIKAEKYQKLKGQIQEKHHQEIVFKWRSLQEQYQQLQSQIAIGDTEASQLTEQLNDLTSKIGQTSTELEQLNASVKALGEEEYLSITSQLATQQAKRHQLQQRQQELQQLSQEQQTLIERLSSEIEQYRQTLSQLIPEKNHLKTEIIPLLANQYQHARETLENSREQAHNIASVSEAWVQEQTALSRKIASLQENLNPYRTEQAQLTERYQRLQISITEQTQRLQTLETEITHKETETVNLSQELMQTEETVQNFAQQLTIAEQTHVIQQDTQKRLLKEQRDKQRELDKHEATKHAQQEAQGTYATQVILQSDLPGVCGLVAQLGEVETRFQLALEISAGARLGQIVVEDDSVAAAGIALLKQRRVGRATFLPLSKIRSPKRQDITALRYARGYINLALNLVRFNPRYVEIFAYVFGSTIVFETIDDARSYLGQYRIVTLEGELLEMSGAMTGGSQPTRSNIKFGVSTNKESEEVESLRKRLGEIEQILVRSEEKITQNHSRISQLTQNLTEAKQKHRESKLYGEQLEKDVQRLKGQREEIIQQLNQNHPELGIAQQRLEVLDVEIPRLEIQLQQEQQRLAELEQSQTHSEWQQLQALIKTQEIELREKEQALRQGEEQLKDVGNKYQRIEEKMRELEQRILDYKTQKSDYSQQRMVLENELLTIADKIKNTEGLLQQLSEKLGRTKQERDRSELNLRALQTEQQQKSWQYEKLVVTQQERQQLLQNLQEQIQLQQAELPDPIPEIILNENQNLVSQLEQLQTEIRQLQKRLEAMEPVNMLALEEYQKTKERVDELSEKLKTIEAERTELLLRIENFTTLRFRSFKEAFDAVNENFQNIFASLSEGDGYLQLDDAEDPFNGGLNLVAHPKGKPVQRLSSMSGGEKSLTALSFIFALQRYRPSPFYAFDEVDMFLDGANVEKLAQMIRKQTQQAQFIVVSLRRPMIEASERTIGVTQARGAHTQVLGIKV